MIDGQFIGFGYFGTVWKSQEIHVVFVLFGTCQQVVIKLFTFFAKFGDFKLNGQWEQPFCIRICNTEIAVLLTHWRPDKMHKNLQTTFSNAFSWMKMIVFLLKFHWNLFPKGPINDIPALVDIMACQATNHYLNQWWPSFTDAYICATRPQWVKLITDPADTTQ